MSTIEGGPSRASMAGVRRRVTAAWGSAGPTGRAGLALVVVAAIALAGAFLFGAWHVIVGWLVKGNPRAGMFGLVLAGVTGVLLAAGALAARRWLPRG